LLTSNFSQSIHADIAYTLGEYLYRKVHPEAENVDMNVSDLVVHKGLVVQQNTKASQLIRVSAEISAHEPGTAKLHWYNVLASGAVEEAFATASVYYGSASQWLDTWSFVTHLVQGRVESLEQLARDGLATRFFKDTAYWMFAKSLVDYAAKYRGMQSVIMKGLEAVAEVQLDTSLGGNWTVPPHFIDSVAHIAGFVMNVSDGVDNTANFCVTPGWRSMRFAKPLTPGAKYTSYVKMLQTKEDPTVYLGDVYIMQEGVVIGLVEGIQFRRYPRILLSRFFSPPDSVKAQQFAAANATPTTAPKKAAPTPAPAATPAPAPKPVAAKPAKALEPVPAAPAPAPPAPKAEAAATPAQEDSGIVAQAMEIIATEAGIDKSELEDDVQFANVGVDSLLSLVIAEKFRADLGVPAAGGLFLEYPTVGEIRTWLTEYYG